MDLETAIDQQRALNSAASRSRRIFRKKSTPKPSALDEIRANSPMAKMGRAFEQSQAPAKRASRVAAAKENGQFDAIRERYNTQYAGKYSMDKDGNVGTSNSSPSASKKADTATPPKAKTPLPPTIARPSDQAETPKPTPRPTSGVIRDETGDITSKIQGRLADKRKPPMTPPSPSSSPKAQTAGEMMKEIDSAISKNKQAISGLNKSFANRLQAAAPKKTASLLEPLPEPKRNEGNELIANTIRGRPLAGGKSFAPNIRANLRAKGGPVTAGQPYLVGEKGPEVVVPKMDSLESVSKKGNFKNGVNSNPRTGSAAGDFNQWFKRLQKKELEKDIAKRPAGHEQLEKDMGLTPSAERMTGYPKTGWEDMKAGLDEGITHIGKTAAGFGSFLPGKVGKEAEKRRQLYDERGQIIEDYRARSPLNKAALVTPGGLVKKAVSIIPEVFNPVNKPGMVAKAVNAAWHGARGYLPDKSLKDAAISSLSSVVGEKAEDLVTKGKGLVGNTVGAVTENVVQRSVPYVVGERGPEIIVPQASGTVIPNHKLPGYRITPAAPPMARPSTGAGAAGYSVDTGKMGPGDAISALNRSFAKKKV